MMALSFKSKSYGVEGGLLLLIKNYVHNREQRVVLNGQTSEWRKIKAGVPQGSVLGPLLFLIYINDLPDGITSICKIFADDTSLFSFNELNSDLERINQWAYQWKMQFNPDPKKKQMKLFFLVNQFHMAYLIRPLNLMKEILKNVIIRNI